MKKRVVSLLLAAALYMGLAVPAWAGGVITGPHCMTNSGQIVAYLDQSGSGDGWRFDAATNTLTLDGFEGKGLTICNTTSPLTLELAAGSVNTLTALFQMEDTSGVIITGTGTLNIQSNNGSSMLLNDSLTIQGGTITANERIMVNAPLAVSGGTLSAKGELSITAMGGCTVTGTGTILLDTAGAAASYPDPKATGSPDWKSGLESACVVGRDGQPLTAQSMGGLMKYVDKAGNLSPYAKITASGAAPVEEEEPIVGSFTDVKQSAYYADPVAWAVEQGVTTGTGATTFTPDRTCTRAEIITFLWRAAGSPTVQVPAAFSDVPVGAYYEGAVAWAAANGLFSGSAFQPDDPCTREMAVEFMWRYAGCPDAAPAGFTDISSDAVDWALETGVTTGTGAGAFSPDRTCTRAEIVTFLYRAFAA